MVDPHLDYLAEAAAAGDRAALEELVVRTQSRVRGFCALLGSAADADDLAQDTYLRALDALPRYRAEASVEVWLLAIARHVCADFVRKRVRRAAIDQRFQPARESLTVQPDTTIEYVGLLDALDRDQRDAFVLTQLIGLSYAEAAAVCDCPVGTIRSRVARARAELHDAVRRAEASSA